MQINDATNGVDLDSSLVTVQGKLQTHQEYVVCFLLILAMEFLAPVGLGQGIILSFAGYAYSTVN